MSELHPIFLDHREDERLANAFKEANVPAQKKQLGVGDIVISDRVAIERKRSDKTYDPERKRYHNDCRDSLQDGRLYTELYNQMQSFKISVLILEIADKKTFFSQRFTQKTLDKVLLTAVLKYNTHIYYTSSYLETAELVKTFWERLNKPPHPAPINRSPRPKSLLQKQRFLVAGLEGCGPKKVDTLLQEFKTPADVFSWVRNPQIKIKGFADKFFASNQQILGERAEASDE